MFASLVSFLFVYRRSLAESCENAKLAGQTEPSGRRVSFLSRVPEKAKPKTKAEPSPVWWSNTPVDQRSGEFALSTIFYVVQDARVALALCWVGGSSRLWPRRFDLPAHPDSQ